jgi:hypothetical protein
MYVSQLLSKENWPKSPDTEEQVYKAGHFGKSLVFFHFLPRLYSDLSSLEKLLLEYVEQTPYYRY